MEISCWPVTTASAAEQQQWYDVWAACHREERPGEPVPPQRAAWFWCTATPAFQSLTLWRAHDDAGRLLGWASDRRELRGSNQGRASIDLQVQEAARHTGVGTALARQAARQARSTGVDVLGFSTTDTPTATGFLSSLGATRCLVETRSVLDFTSLDHDAVADWAQRPEGAEAYSLVRWDNGMTDADIIELARIYTVMNTAPRGELTLNDEQPDPGARREWLNVIRAAGDDYVTFCARHDPSEEIAGFTMVRVHRTSWPGHGFQEDTAVAPAHRGHRLGLWLKSSMLQDLRHSHPLLRRLETWNAAENEHMLAINNRLGYTATTTETDWELSGAALEHLAG